MWKIGDTIDTPHGKGIITGIQGKKAKVNLTEHQNLPIIVQLDTIESQAPTPNSSGDQRIVQNTNNSLSTLEALRFGLVPHQSIEDLTIDFDHIKDWVSRRLPHSNKSTPQVSQISGPFGSGKSHTMGIIRHIALQENYLTVHAEVDGEHISLSNPETLLYSLAESLEGTDVESEKLWFLCLESINQGKSAPEIPALGSKDRINNNFNTIKELSVNQEWCDSFSSQMNDVLSSNSMEVTASQVRNNIKRDTNIYPWEVKPTKMIGQLVNDRPYDFVEAIIGYCRLAVLQGYKGLVVTIDEFEVEQTISKNYGRTQQLLDMLYQYWQHALDDYPQVPLGMFIATVSDDPTRNSASSVVANILSDYVKDTYEIRTLKAEDRRALAIQLHDFYTTAYGIDNPYTDNIFDTVELRIADTGESGPAIMRSFIKEYLASLDSAYRPASVGD